MILAKSRGFYGSYATREYAFNVDPTAAGADRFSRVRHDSRFRILDLSELPAEQRARALPV